MPNRAAATTYPILPCLANRWSPRSFADRPVEADQLRSLFEAARWAASSFNEQPWRFILATRDDGAGFADALECLADANRAWAQHAPVLVITAVTETFSRNGTPNRCAEHDLGLALGNLSAQATELGIAVHHMAGIDLERCRETYQLPEGCHAFSALAIGYPGDPANLPEGWMHDAETAPRSRNPFDDFVFGGAFGQPSGLFAG